MQTGHCTIDEIAEHTLTALRISRNPAKLRQIQVEIAQGVRNFLRALRSQIAEEEAVVSGFADMTLPDRRELLAKAEIAARAIERKPITWYADKHDWKRRGELVGAGFLLKMQGRIGKGFTPLVQ